jgi:hypothetical protein
MHPDGPKAELFLHRERELAKAREIVALEPPVAPTARL